MNKIYRNETTNRLLFVIFKHAPNLYKWFMLYNFHNGSYQHGLRVARLKLIYFLINFSTIYFYSYFCTQRKKFPSRKNKCSLDSLKTTFLSSGHNFPFE